MITQRSLQLFLLAPMSNYVDVGPTLVSLGTTKPEMLSTWRELERSGCLTPGVSRLDVVMRELGDPVTVESVAPVATPRLWPQRFDRSTHTGKQWTAYLFALPVWPDVLFQFVGDEKGLLTAMYFVRAPHMKMQGDGAIRTPWRTVLDEMYEVPPERIGLGDVWGELIELTVRNTNGQGQGVLLQFVYCLLQAAVSVE